MYRETTLESEMNKERKELCIKKLQESVELKLGYLLKTPKDFERCRATIFSTLHDNISISTLKRIWGYVVPSDDYQPSWQSLDVLAQFAGYGGFSMFCTACCQAEGNTKVDAMFVIESISNNIQQVERDLNILRNMLKE